MKPTKEGILSIITTSNGYKVSEEDVISNTALEKVDYINITSSLNYRFKLKLTEESSGFDRWTTIGDYVNYVLENK